MVQDSLADFICTGRRRRRRQMARGKILLLLMQNKPENGSTWFWMESWVVWAHFGANDKRKWNDCRSKNELSVDDNYVGSNFAGIALSDAKKRFYNNSFHTESNKCNGIHEIQCYSGHAQCEYEFKTLGRTP